MTLNRKEAIILCSYIEFFSLNKKNQDRIINEAISERGWTKLKADLELKYAVRYIQSELQYVSNFFLKNTIDKSFCSNITVIGKSPVLVQCVCCDYKSLKRKSEYEICKICYWEDDGTSDLLEFSTVNGMTLNDAKQNFENEGIVSKKYANYVNGDRFARFDK